MIGALWHLLALAPHLAALTTLALLSLRLLGNLWFLRRIRQRDAAPSALPPRVSVLVPARNEAATITACVQSLLEQRYANLEVIVLDDGSTDGTGELLDALRARYPALITLRAGDEPPPGWNGKSYACQRLADRATGEWLLFTDADTIHTPESVARGMTCALALDVTLLSAFPYQMVRTWSERILVSFLIDFLPLVSINIPALAGGKRTRVAANGQYLLAHASAYRALGGHASIASALVDDFALASRFQAQGQRIALIPGGEMLSCRMYTSASAVWNGFAKNLLGALSAPQRWGTLLFAPLFALLYACLFVLPFAHLAASGERALALVEIGWLLALRAVVVWRLRRPLDEIVTTPLAAWGVMALGMVALFRRWRNQRILWKGRAYSG